MNIERSVVLIINLSSNDLFQVHDKMVEVTH